MKTMTTDRWRYRRKPYAEQREQDSGWSALAAAIEALEAKVADYEDTLKWHQKEFAELRAMIDDANARFEVGKAGNKYTLNEPKRGEWKYIVYHNGCTPDEDIVCSVCGKSGLDYWNFCPNCGAKMEVQDANK